MPGLSQLGLGLGLGGRAVLEGPSAGLARWACSHLGRSIRRTPRRSRANEGGWCGTESHEDVAPALLSDAVGSLSCGQEFPPSSAGPEPLRRRAGAARLSIALTVVGAHRTPRPPQPGGS